MIVKRFVSLRGGFWDRVEEARTMGETIIFVNQAHTLAHVHFDSVDGDYVRAKIPAWLKGTHDHYFHQWCIRRFGRYV